MTAESRNDAQLRIGLIGAGHFARNHVEALGGFADRARIVAYARQDPDRGFPEAEAAGAQRLAAEALIASPDVDAVLVCTPNHLHRQYAEAGLRAGKHVFCEKPLALTAADADAVLEAASATDAVFMVGHLARHIPAYAAVAGLLETGRLGTPVAAYANRMHCGGGGRSWRMDPNVGGGVVFDLLVHDLDLLNWYLGPPVSVVARGRRHAQGGYDYIAATFAYADGKVAMAEGGFVFRPPAGLRATTRVVCERGHVEVNTHDKECPIRVFEEDRPEEIIPVKLDNLLVDGLAAEFGEFFDAVDGRPRGRLRPEDARLAVACAEAVVRAADTAEEVTIL